ncbi:MAG: Ku protein [Deltaproteobacteria bacterium]|nr:Ku protein [Deltaproteobacteria bacterium]MBI3387184.1 Ku protein [Deltaproteobacteria bacterium]
MAARAIASGTITFGLVSVPVKLFTATRSKSLSFNLLHATDKSRLRQQYVCATCSEVVERSAMVKGYEYAKDQYAILTDEELKALDEQSDQSIEIEEFVPISEVDPIYFEKAYLLGPDKGGHKAYRLLCEAMAKAGQGAIGKFSTRGKQQLVLLRQAQGGLLLHALSYADEVSSFVEIDRGEAVTLKPGEIDLAIQLIERLAAPSFQPEKYEDSYRKKALDVIERKVAGQEVVMAPAHAPRAQIIDLMEALKASLDLKQRARAPVAASAETRKPSRAKGLVSVARKTAAKAK